MTEPSLHFGADSTSLLLRAEELLARFDTEDHAESLVFAALLLRMGIESRLFEYIEAALPSDHRRQGLRKISQYTASDLLKRLVRIDEFAAEPATIVSWADDGHSPGAVQFVPISPQLATIHGKLGTLLHARYYFITPAWQRNVDTGVGEFTTLRSARRVIADGLRELRLVVSGALLAHPRFAEWVESLADDAGPVNDQVA